MLRHSPRIETSVNDRIAAAAAFGLGLAAILGALAFQYVGGLYPCPLCLTQRWPYYIGLPALALLVLLWNRLTEPLRIGFLLGAGGLFLWGAGVGAYHAGVEYAFWPGPQSCAGVGDDVLSLDMLSDLSSVRLVACDQVAWDLFGISLAGFNALISLVILGLIVWALVGQVRKAR